jgi:hypothetical protein
MEIGEVEAAGGVVIVTPGLASTTLFKAPVKM